MSLLPGVYKAKKANGSTYYRASVTYKNKHISLGSFNEPLDANLAYTEARDIIDNNLYTVNDYNSDFKLSLEKFIILLNFRDNKIYCKTPIYLSKDYFTYYLSDDIQLLFDVQDYFYYSYHKIMKRGNHLFISDYDMQMNILSRFGIHNYAVVNRDYVFVNGNPYDFRYSNIKVINPYYGVTKITKNNKDRYLTKIHVKGDLIVGIYSTEIEAAIAYNKASDYLKKNGIKKNFPQNYINEISGPEYLRIYKKINVRYNVIHYTIN
ncbi:MAG: hypothetical protein E7262_05340 [Lachnospiraceae bacterium]|nr:hypothetical protein [Lachnospiraceae bacterium]